jgi:hypothetical protein
LQKLLLYSIESVFKTTQSDSDQPPPLKTRGDVFLTKKKPGGNKASGILGGLFGGSSGGNSVNFGSAENVSDQVPSGTPEDPAVEGDPGNSLYAEFGEEEFGERELFES